MRIHWSIVTISALGVILLTWFYRTREIDFMTPRETALPPEDFGADLGSTATSLQPKIDVSQDPGNSIATVEPIEEEPEIPEITPEELGDLEASPGLDSYRQFAREKDAAQLFILSSTLRAQGEFQRALLALERVIDSTAEVTSEELLEAGQGIAALTPTLPMWNVDPTNESQLVLEVGIPRDDEPTKEAVLELATLIRKHSGDLFEVIPKINSPDQEVEIENPPIALWFSTGGNSPASCATVTMTPGGDEALLDDLSRAAFQAVRSHLTKLGYSEAGGLPEASGTELLTLQVTRLMWRDFSKSLLAEQAKAAEETAEEKDSP